MKSTVSLLVLSFIFLSDQVAEMTGRRGRVVSLPDGTVQYQLRSESDVSLEMLNLEEKRRFMDGDKIIAIISEAASSGISLQSDKRVKVRETTVVRCFTSSGQTLSFLFLFRITKEDCTSHLSYRGVLTRQSSSLVS